MNDSTLIQVLNAANVNDDNIRRNAEKVLNEVSVFFFTEVVYCGSWFLSYASLCPL